MSAEITKLIAQARAVVAEEHGWGAMELAERGGRLMHWVEMLCIVLEDTTDPKGAQDRADARYAENLARFTAERAELARKLALLRDDPHAASGDGPDQSLGAEHVEGAHDGADGDPVLLAEGLG